MIALTIVLQALGRLAQCLLVLLIALDIVAQAIIKAPVWVLFKRAKPSTRETISATFGQWAATGSPVGKWLAEQVDDVFGQGHCANAYAGEAARNEVVNV